MLALKTDETGALWIGTDNGAARMANGRFDPIKETAGKVITAIITPQKNRAIMSSEGGQIFDCQVEVTNPSALALTEALNSALHLKSRLRNVSDRESKCK